MIDFIIVENNTEYLKHITSMVDKIMIKTCFEYRKKAFAEYDDKFNNYINRNFENKIYILDIKTDNKNGIDVAREIRKKDSEAIIIFLTAHEKYGNRVLKNMIEAFSFICKKDNVEEILEQNILEILNRIRKNKNIIKIEDNTSIYAIPLSKILYITIDSKKRKAIIKTDIKNIECKKTLNYFEKLYHNDLIRTHKSCVVNINRTINFDFKNNKIYFNNNSETELLSKKYKEKIKEKFFK